MNNFVVALDLALSLLMQAQKIQILIAQAQAEGHAGLTQMQLDELVDEADAAKERLERALEAARVR